MQTIHIMKKRKLIFTACLTALVFITGCSDEFLTREPQGSFSEGDVATADGVEGLLIGAYTMVPGGGLQGQTWHNDIHSWVFNIASDDALKGPMLVINLNNPLLKPTIFNHSIFTLEISGEDFTKV